MYVYICRHIRFTYVCICMYIYVYISIKNMCIYTCVMAPPTSSGPLLGPIVCLCRVKKMFRVQLLLPFRQIHEVRNHGTSISWPHLVSTYNQAGDRCTDFDCLVNKQSKKSIKSQTEINKTSIRDQ